MFSGTKQEGMAVYDMASRWVREISNSFHLSYTWDSVFKKKVSLALVLYILLINSELNFISFEKIWTILLLPWKHLNSSGEPTLAVPIVLIINNNLQIK